MNRSYFLAALVFLLLLIGLGTMQPAILVLSIPPFMYLLAGFWNLPESLHLRVERTISAERVKTGDAVIVTLQVENEGSSIEELTLGDLLPPGLEVISGNTQRWTSLPAGKSISWSYTVRGQRGYYGMNSLHVEARETLGLKHLEKDLPTEGQLYIQPPVLRLRRIAIQPRRTRVYSGVIPARQGGAGVEFFDVREYQQGDLPRWINWRATARPPQNIYSNEFEQERAADVGLILDGRHRTNDFGVRSIFEHSILATASLADTFLNAGNRVGLLFYGRHITWTMPGYGKIQGERILHDLAQLEPGESQNFSELYIPRHLFPSRSQLVLVSSLIDEDENTLIGLRSMGYHLLVISPDPISFETQGMAETSTLVLAKRIVLLKRTILLRHLRRAGVQVVDWDTSLPFEKIAKRELEQHLVMPRGISR